MDTKQMKQDLQQWLVVNQLCLDGDEMMFVKVSFKNGCVSPVELDDDEAEAFVLTEVTDVNALAHVIVDQWVIRERIK